MAWVVSPVDAVVNRSRTSKLLKYQGQYFQKGLTVLMGWSYIARGRTMKTARAQGISNRRTLSLRNPRHPFFCRETGAKNPAAKKSRGIIKTSNSSRMISAVKEVVSWTTQWAATEA